MEEIHCNSCAYYRQHYILDGKKLFRIYCGHCTKPKGHTLFRSRKPDKPICDQYLPSLPDEEAFVTREYLSKALLDRVLSLPLLPQIEDRKL